MSAPSDDGFDATFFVTRSGVTATNGIRIRWNDRELYIKTVVDMRGSYYVISDPVATGNMIQFRSEMSRRYPPIVHGEFVLPNDAACGKVEP